MNVKIFRKVRTLAALFWAVLLLGSAAENALAQLGGQFISATPQSPISLGQALRITVNLRNDTDSVWTLGDGYYDFSWMVEVENASWSPHWVIDFVSMQDVEPDDTVSATLSLEATNLPSAPGNYSVSLTAFCNLEGWVISEMNNSPKTVSFTINAGNHAPVIAPIGEKIAVEPNLLSFQVTATDTDTPAQTLTYTLNPGAPSGASINSSNGLFTWTPPAGYGPRTNQISVCVTDNGSPALSATNTFNVVVVKPLRLQVIKWPSDDVIRLFFETLPGRTYRLRYKDSLTTGSWINLGSDVQATETVTSLTNNAGTLRQRYYQVLLLH